MTPFSPSRTCSCRSLRRARGSKAFGVALRARISQLPATCLTWPDPADDDADDLIPDFPPGGGDDEIHVFHHMSSIELENYEA